MQFFYIFPQILKIAISWLLPWAIHFRWWIQLFAEGIYLLVNYYEHTLLPGHLLESLLLLPLRRMSIPYRLSIGTFLITDVPFSESESSPFNDSDSNNVRKKRSVDDYTVELMVVVDKTMVDFHGDDTQHYVLVMLNSVSDVKNFSINFFLLINYIGRYLKTCLSCSCLKILLLWS